MRPPPSPNDSAISFVSAQSPNPTKPYPELSPEEQTAQDLESIAAVQQAQEEIDIDSGIDGQSDAGYETDSLGGSSSTSMDSSIRDYAFENGRRYHRFREGQYNFPNEDSEQERENMKHFMVMNLCRTHLAPIGSNPHDILDMGTGTGAWAIEMGDLYPSANVLGVDLSPIQPEWVPPNVQFVVDDVEDTWLKPENYYDYIHARHTVMAIKDWPKLMKNVFDHLKPGGWFELQEIHHYPYSSDNSIPTNNLVAEYWALVIAGLSNLGVNFNATLLLENMMREAGFVNVSTTLFHVPIGMWPRNRVLKTVGQYWRTILMDGLQPIAMGPFTRGLGWSREQVDVYLVGVRKAYEMGGPHYWMPLHVICGQKPM